MSEFFKNNQGLVQAAVAGAVSAGVTVMIMRGMKRRQWREHQQRVPQPQASHQTYTTSGLPVHVVRPSQRVQEFPTAGQLGGETF